MDARPQAPAARRPLRRDAERNRERILEAAAEVFTTQGLGASLDDVARQAGVGVGTVYRRFPDKESLVSELFTSRVAALVALAESACEIPDPWDGLVWFLTQVAGEFAGNLGLRQMMMFGTYGSDSVGCVREQMRPVITRLVERAKSTGQLREDFQPTDVPFIGFMLSVTAQYAGEISPGIWSRYLTLIIDGMRTRRPDTTPLRVPALEPADMERLIRTQGTRTGRRPQ